MAHKLAVVARHEFIGTVTRLGYLVTLVGMPLFVLGIGALSGFAAYRTQLSQQAERKAVGLVDDSGLFAKAPLEVPEGELPDELPPELARPRLTGGRITVPPAPIALQRFANLPEAKARLQAGELSSILHIPASYLRDGKLEELVRPQKGFNPSGGTHARKLRTWLAGALLAGRVAPDLAERASRPLWDVDTLVLEPGGKVAPQDLLRAMRPLIVPMGFALLLMLSVFTSASFLATGLNEEKQNRALEMLLTSITPEQLFWGKLIGIGGAAFLQFLLYLVAVALPAAFLFSALDLHLAQAFTGLAYFVLGFFFFGSVLLAVGAIGNTQKYTQQLSAVFTFTAVIPMMMLQPILQDPSGGLARLLTFIPFTAPITGMLRAGAGALPAWEMALSLALLLAGCWAAVKSCSKIFRVALLSSGTTPSLQQVWRWLRA